VFLPALLAITPESVRSRWVTRDTDLVVEGFPRSGNTFAALGIASAQSRPVRIVSHAHVPAQFKRAVALGVPTIVAVRDPADATCSMAVADPHHRVRDLLRYWIHYHEQLLEVVDGVVVASFEDITQRLSGVVDAVNDRFATGFEPVGDDPETRERIFAAIDGKQRAVHGEARYHEAVPRPDPQRSVDAARRRAELDSTVAPETLARARALHQRLVDRR
jgi:hypothetical protein